MPEEPKPPKNPNQTQLNFSSIENEKDKLNAELIALKAENKTMAEEKKASDTKLKAIADKEKEKLLKEITDEEYKDSSLAELQLIAKDRAKRLTKGAERHPKKDEDGKDEKKYFGQYNFNKQIYE